MSVGSACLHCFRVPAMNLSDYPYCMGCGHLREGPLSECDCTSCLALSLPPLVVEAAAENPEEWAFAMPVPAPDVPDRGIEPLHVSGRRLRRPITSVKVSGERLRLWIDDDAHPEYWVQVCWHRAQYAPLICAMLSHLTVAELRVLVYDVAVELAAAEAV